MSMTGLDIFDKAVQITNTWLDEINGVLGPDRDLAWHVLGVVLRAVRDRFPVDLAARLGAELPLIVRGAYYDQFQPAAQPRIVRSREEFLARVAEALHGIRPVNPEAAVRAVLNVLSSHLSYGQVAKMRAALPEDIQALWPDAGIEPQAGRQAAGQVEQAEQTAAEGGADAMDAEADADRRQAARSLRRARAQAREMTARRGQPGAAMARTGGKAQRPRRASGKAPTRH